MSSIYNLFTPAGRLYAEHQKTTWERDKTEKSRLAEQASKMTYKDLPSDEHGIEVFIHVIADLISDVTSNRKSVLKKVAKQVSMPADSVSSTTAKQK